MGLLNGPKLLEYIDENKGHNIPIIDTIDENAINKIVISQRKGSNILKRFLLGTSLYKIKEDEL